MSNRVRTPALRQAYDNATRAFAARNSSLFQPDRSRNTLNGIGTGFWPGYDGVLMEHGFRMAASRKTDTYAAWCAGRDARAAERKAR